MSRTSEEVWRSFEQLNSSSEGLQARDLSGAVEGTHTVSQEQQRLLEETQSAMDANANSIEEHVNSLFQPFIEQLLTGFHVLFPGYTSNMQDEVVSNLKERLRPLIYHALDKELAKYRADLSASGIDLESMSAISAQQHLINYFEKYKSEHGSASTGLTSKYPQLEVLCQKVTEAHIESNRKLAERLGRDQEILKRFFASTISGDHSVKNLTLVNISSTGSDPHNMGQQVLILSYIVEMDDGTIYNKKMIYKPTPVEMDASITGDSSKLGKVIGKDAPRYFFETLNQHGPKHELPTYLIVPMCDPDGDNIGNGYGYVEYLSHSPWNEKDIDDEAKKFFAKFPPSERIKHTDEFQEHLNELFKSDREEGLRDLAKCDYITDQQSDVDRYSYLCGAYAAAMCVLGISDMHVENLIISGKKPFLIDLEVALNIAGHNIDSTHAFDANIGSMLGNTRSPVSWSCFLDVEGEFSSRWIAHVKPDRNLFYNQQRCCLFISKGEPKPCAHNTQQLEEGFRDIVEMVCRNQAEFIQFAESLTDKPARIVPVETAVMYGTKSGFIATSLDAGSNPETFAEIIKDTRLEQLKAFGEEMDLPPIFMVYDDEYFKKQFECGSIPTFYIRANRQELFDCNGNTIVQPLEAKAFIVAGQSLTEGEIARINKVLELYVIGGQLCYHKEQSPINSVIDNIKKMTREDMMSMFYTSFAAKTLKLTKAGTEVKEKVDRDCCIPVSCRIS